MTKEHRGLDDLARLLTGVAGLAKGMEREVEEALRRRFETWLGEIHPVSREEHDAVLEMARLSREEAIGLREEIAALRERIEALEGKGATGGKKDSKK